MSQSFTYMNTLAEGIGALFGTETAFGYGTITGLAIAAIVALLIWLLLRLFGFANRLKGISVPGENGELFVSIHAVREFIKRIMGEFNEAYLQNLTLHEVRNTLVFEVGIDVIPDTNFVPLRDKIQDRILREATEKIGTEQPVKVRVTILNVGGKAGKQQRKDRSAEETDEGKQASSEKRPSL